MEKSFNIPIRYSDTAARNVIATAIDGETLILKDAETGEQINWPLTSIPKPLEIGANMCLELKNSTGPSIDKKNPENNEAENANKIHLLEELIN